MKTTRKSFRKTSLALAAVMVCAAAPTQSALGASCTWNPATGDWSSSGNWSCGAVPTGPAQDGATIASGKTVTVSSAQSIYTLGNAGTIDINAFTLTLQNGGSTTNSGTINIGTSSVTAALQASNDILNTGGLITVANGSFLNQFSSSITGGTINTTGTGVLAVLSNGGNFLNGVTINGSVDANTATNARERIGNGLTLNGNMDIGNGGIVSLDSTTVANNAIGGNGSFTLKDSSARLAIEGTGTTTLGVNIVVQGQGNIGTAAFSAGVNTLVNQGTISANVNGGTLTLAQPGNSGSVTNTGTLGASNGGTLALNANIANAGGTISAGTGASVQQNGITVSGGAITTTGTGTFVAASNSNNFLDGVALTGTLDLATLVNARERIVNGATINGSVNVANGGILSLDSANTTGGAQTIQGTATVNLNDPGALLSIEGSGATTLGSGITVRGQGTIGAAEFGAGNNTLTSNGKISADVAGGTLEITAPGNSGSFVNNGILQAVNGGTLKLSTNITANSGSQIVSGAGSTVLQNGVTINGTFASSGGGLFTASSNGNNILNDVSFSGALDASSVTNARERIGNNLALTGSVTIGNGGVVSLDGTLGATNAISGAATFNLADSSALLAVEGTGTTTLGSGVVVQGQGQFGHALFSSGNNALTNNGQVLANVSGGVLDIQTPANSGSFTNNGTLKATNGGILQLSTSILANAGSKIVADVGSQVIQNGVTLNGTLQSNGSGFITATSNGNNNLSGAALTGTLDVSSVTNARERVNGGFTLNGVVNIGNGGIVSLDSTQVAANPLTGSGTFNLNDASAALTVDGTGITTLGSGIVVRGQGLFGQALFSSGNNVLTNNGRISADVGGGTLTIQQPANSGSLVNNNLMDARNGGTLLLATSVANGLGQINAQDGSTVTQSGITITGGAINTTGSGSLMVSSNGNNVLDGVTVGGLVDMSTAVNARERIVDGATLNGNINIANGAILSLDTSNTASGSQVIAGNVSINLNDASAAVSVEGTGTTTLGSGVVIHGQGSVGQALFTAGNDTLVNNGRITADVNGGTLALNTPGNSGVLVNNNLVDARNGGTLALNTNVNNAGGQISAQAGSRVMQNGITVSGGAIVTTGTGAFVVTSNGSNALDGVQVGGTVDMSSVVNARERIVNGGTINGSVNIANGGILSLDSSQTTGGNQTIGGSGTINLNDANARLSIEGTGITTLGANLTVRGQGNIGTALFSSGANTLVNNGTLLADVGGGTLTITAPANSGTLVGTGTLQANGGTLNLATGTDSTQGKLVVGATGAVNLNTNNLTITSDYTNAQSGSGNAFNRHAGISGSGQILAGGNAAQAITGAGVTNGDSANATLTIGNVRVGTTTVGYQIANTGTSGPSLRGAVQTNVNGASITDARLGGTGVTAGNYNTGAPGSGTSLGVSFTVATAGALAPLTGQSVNLRSNFDNIADQKLNIVLGSGAAAYQAAAGQLQTPALNFGIVQVGQSVSQNLVVGNVATGAAGFVEDLNASFGASTGTGASQISGSGSLLGILAGTSSTAANGAMTVTVDTSHSGSINGGITVNYATAGAVNGVSNGLGTASVGSQNYGVAGTINAVATVVNQASPLVNTTSVDLGARRVGDAAATAAISVTNQSTASPQASLNAAITSNGAPVTASGSFNLLAPGATNTSALTVGLSTATAGNFTGANAGSASIGLVSDASSLGDCGSHCQLTLASQQVSVSGKVYSAAVAQVDAATIDFGIVHVGDTVATRGVSVTNSGAASALSDVLTGSFGNASGPFTASGTLSGVAAQASNNGSFQAGLNTSASGVFNGTATATLQSHDADLADLALGSTDVALKGQVNNYAESALAQAGGAASLTHAGSVYTLDFGTLTQGATDLSDLLAVLNGADGLSDLLSGSFDVSGSHAGFELSGFDAVAGLGAGQSQGGFMVTLDSAATGSFDDTLVFHAIGSNASGYSASLADITLVLEGEVTSAAAVPEPGNTGLLLAGLATLFGLGRLKRRPQGGAKA